VTTGDGSIKVDDSYSLDMQRAIITKSARNATLQVEEMHLAHQTRRNLLLRIVNATNRGSSKTALKLAQYPGPSCGAEFTEGGCPKPDVKLLRVNCSHHRCVNGSIVQSETPSSPLLVVAMASTLIEPTVWVEAGETKTVVFVRALSSTLDGGTDPLAVAVTALEQALKCDVEQLLSEHVAGWAEIWESGLEVEGDADLAAAINGSIYNILSSLRADWPYGSSPGGLASAGYHGHVFWDQETWMWPPMNHLHPPIAAAMLEYRTARQGAAAANANSYGLPGLQYPWESTQTGVPADTWQKFGPEGSSCETYEIHIGGDIAQAFWRYWASTGDKNWLCSEGDAGSRPIDILRGIALYYSARVSSDLSTHGQYELLAVTGPDEQVPEVDNSCYVSSIASLTMQAAANLSSICGLQAPSNWTTIAASLKVPTVQPQRPFPP
jgi:trehalose/maltose hydrolase-like predicted phosphorylase